jgi:hypothetical protein
MITDSYSDFIILIAFEINLVQEESSLDQKEILLKEISVRVGDKIGEQTVSEKVDQFIKYGNVFLLFEIVNLRKEIERIKEENQASKTK